MSDTCLPLIVALRLEGTPSLVVGGGKVALQRVEALLRAGGRPCVVAEQPLDALRQLAGQGDIRLIHRRFREADLAGARLVLVAIDDETSSRCIAKLARSQRIPVNVADAPALCDFYFCAVHRQGPLQIAVSTNGKGPGLASRLRTELARALPVEVTEAIGRFSQVRDHLRDHGRSKLSERMSFLRGLSKRLSWSDLAQLEPSRTLWQAEPKRLATRDRKTVHLVGSGPGDPELLTVKARTLLESADLVLADRLIPPALLALVGGELRIADKAPGRSESSQEQLHRWMIEGANQGRAVVRLKIGDPYVFGRGGEEVAALSEQGIHVEVVPGVTSAFAAPMVAGIPTTLRGAADRTLIFTAAGRGGTTPMPPTYHPSTTFIALMGMRALPGLVRALLGNGFPRDLPAACVVNATCENEQSIRAPLHALPKMVEQSGLEPPGVLIFGDVCAFPGSGITWSACSTTKTAIGSKAARSVGSP